MQASPVLAALLLAAAAPCGGCSLLLVRAPPAAPLAADASPGCTSSRLAPAVDLVLGGIAAGAGVALMVDAGRGRSCKSFECPGVSAAQSAQGHLGVALLGVGAAGLASGSVGWQRTGACRELSAPPLQLTRGEAGPAHWHPQPGREATGHQADGGTR